MSCKFRNWVRRREGANPEGWGALNGHFRMEMTLVASLRVGLALPVAGCGSLLAGFERTLMFLKSKSPPCAGASVEIPRFFYDRRSRKERKQQFNLLQLWLASVFADLKGLSKFYRSSFLRTIPFDEVIAEPVRLSALTPDPAFAQSCLATRVISGWRNLRCIRLATICPSFVML